MGQGGCGLRAQNKSEEGADDVKRQVDSDSAEQLPIYQLVNVKNGGGKLIDLIKSNVLNSSGSFTLQRSTEQLVVQRQLDDMVDKEIYDLVEPLLYNGGKGKLLPLSRIWMSRVSKMKMDEDETFEDLNSNKSRLVCWKLEKRGHVGETALHICFLLSTPTHMILAKKLLRIFPLLINDIYTSDQYFGESSLHMTIVNEDVSIVKLLLDHGANVHERCLGSFFLPIDQKETANMNVRTILERPNLADTNKQILNQLDDLDLECNQLSNCQTTSFYGYAYWGEYPLSFACCLGLTDCFKLLLAKGANPNRQDSNGNTALHMAVIADRINMFDLCYSSGADLNIVNKQNLSPLNIAVKLRRVELFFHILALHRQVGWIFSNVGFLEMPLEQLDSIEVNDGSCDSDSALALVVFGSFNEQLNMLDGLLDQLLSIKWKTSIRKKFYWWLVQFLFFMIVCSVVYITRFQQTYSKTNSIPPNNHSWQQVVNKYGEYLLICYVIYYLATIIPRLASSYRPEAALRSLVQAPEISMFLFTCLLILTCIPLRLLDRRQEEDAIVALVMFTLPLKLLFFCRASGSVGSFVVMIYKIVVNDVVCFIIFLIIFVAGFSQSFLIMFKTHIAPNNSTMALDKNYFSNLFDGIISMHMMAYNEFGIVFDEFNQTDYPLLARLLFCIYMILVSILLINMLIAMLGKTYQDIASQPNENLRQWARALLTVERMCTREERLAMLEKYSHQKLVDGKVVRYFGSTWPLTQEDRNKLTSMDNLKRENRIGASRLCKDEKISNTC